MKYFYSILILLTLFAVSCETAQTRNRDLFSGKDVDVIDSSRLVAQLQDLNKNSPSSLKARFYIHGTIKNKQYKTLGRASYNRNLNRTNVTITDFIFKSPLTILYQEGNSLKLYFPVDKRLYLDDLNRIQLNNYSGIQFDFDFLHKLFTGTIPVLDDYRVVKSVKDKKNNQQFLIIENQKYYETISFKNNLPDRLLFINKRSKEKIEFYLSKPVKKGSSQFFQKVRIIAKRSSMKLDINFSGVSLNGAVTVKSLEQLRIPKNVKVIRM